MGYAVLHLEKGAGNDAPITAHIERKINPANADKNKTHLNRELIEFPEGVANRTEAIQHRIETAGITRKISRNQVRALRFIMSGSPDDMKLIQDESRLDAWCKDSLDWLGKEVGRENIVSAVLHMDEKTPHIHATVVPIVTGERRKAKQEQQITKKKYKKKSVNAPRLCADDIMSREKFKHFQDTYAEAMNKYGLQRGVEGSEARHITTQQYYRELVDKNADLKKEIQSIECEQKEVYEKVRYLYDRKDEATEKFWNIDKHLHQKEQEIATVEAKLQKVNQEYKPYKAQEELNLIHDLFPMMKEQLRIADFCKNIGLAFESIKVLFAGKGLTAKTFSFFSPEHNQKFTAVDAKIKIEKEPDNPNKLRLNLNGMNILDWFKQKYSELQNKNQLKISPKSSKMKIG